MRKFSVLISLVLTMAFCHTANCFQPPDGETLYAKVVKGKDGYAIESISPYSKEGNVVLNNWSPNFNTKDRSCGEYWATGSPANKAAEECERLKDFEFMKINVSKKNLIVFLNVIVGAGAHIRYGEFDKEEYQKAIAQVSTGVDNKKIAENYQYLLRREKELLANYNSNVSDLTISYTTRDMTGLYVQQDLSEQTISHLDRKSPTKVEKMSASEAVAFLDRDSIDRALTEKYRTIHLNSFYKTSSGFSIEVGDAWANNQPHPAISIPTTIKCRNLTNIIPDYHNSDKYLDVNLQGDNISFTNKTGEYLKIDAISLYYKDYVVTRTLNDETVELPPFAHTTEPISIYRFIDERVTFLSSYQCITAGDAKKISIDFGLAIKYSFVDNNKVNTLYKLQKYSLYGLATSGSEKLDFGLVKSGGKIGKVQQKNKEISSPQGLIYNKQYLCRQKCDLDKSARVSEILHMSPVDAASNGHNRMMLSNEYFDNCISSCSTIR